MKKILAFTLIASLIASPVLVAHNEVAKKKENRVWAVIKNYVLPGVGLVCGFLVLRWGWNKAASAIQRANLEHRRQHHRRGGGGNYENMHGAFDLSYIIEPPVRQQEAPAQQIARIAQSANFNGQPVHIQQQAQFPALRDIQAQQLFLLPSHWDQPYRNLVGVVVTPAANGNLPAYHVVVPQHYDAQDQGPLKEFLGWLQPELQPDHPLFRVLAD